MQQRYQIGFSVDRQGNRPVEIYLFDHSLNGVSSST